MKKSILLILLAICYINTKAQTTVVFQPDGTAGKDALLHGLASEINTNYGNATQLPADAWTFGGTPGLVRSVIEFDLTSIPANAKVISAQLSLYAWDLSDGGGLGQHSTLSGPNDSWLERVTSGWNESSVTWSTQPTTTPFNRLHLPASTYPTEDYLNLNVDIMAQDMIKNPASNFGFMLKLNNESYYRNMNFCSSDHADPALRAKLVITYIIANDTCITLQPDAANGKDALLHGLLSEANTNYGNADQFPANAWTFGGTPGVVRSVIEFDLSSIPSNATITSAKLSLFAWDNSGGGGMGQHSTLSGPNDSWVERVTSAWNESTVTWNSQPTTSAVGRIALPASTYATEDYLDIGVDAMVQDMVKNPASNFGFMLKLQNESYYRIMNFCSSDHANAALHPKLEICYFLPTDSCLTFQPDGAAGKDALLHGLASEADVNYGNATQFPADAWTFNGPPGVLRSVIEFDLSSIPSNATVTSAQLSLYAWDLSDGGGLGQHSTLSGPNDCWLERVTSAWNESTVTWNNQPATNAVDRVAWPASTYATEDYLNINVAAMVQDMVNNPATNFGFMLKLQDETYYRNMNFCSSDHANAALRPKLEVCFKVNSSSVKPDASFNTTHTIICMNDCIDYTDLSTNATAWNWTFDGALPPTSTLQNPQSICYLTSGKYDVTLIASNSGGSDTLTITNYITVNVAPPTPNITQSHDTLFCGADTSYKAYQWYFNSGLLPGETNSYLVIASGGNYNLKVTNSTGCETAVGIVLGVQTFADQFISVSPNPAHSHLSIHASTLHPNEAVTVSIVNVLGELMQQEKINWNGDAIINIKALSSGIYFLQLKSEGSSFAKKFLKE